MDETALRGAVLEVLAGHSVCTLATRHRDRPHAVSVMYASRGLELYWVSDPDTRHSGDLERDPRAAVTIARQYDDFSLIKGLQMTGRARRLTGAGAEAALGYLRARFDFFGPLIAAAAAGSGPLATASAYRFDPDQVTLIDNTVEFGFKETLNLNLDAGSD